MAIEAISAIGGDIARSTAIAAPAAAGTDFATLLGDGLTRVDHSLQAADTQLRSLAAGENIAIHDVMISMEQARLDLMLMAEVRNRMIEAYQELTRMQL